MICPTCGGETFQFVTERFHLLSIGDVIQTMVFECQNPECNTGVECDDRGQIIDHFPAEEAIY